MTGKKKQRPGSLVSAATVFLCVWAAEFGHGASTDIPALPDTASADAMLSARSLVRTGDRARMQRVMVRASQGDPVTVAVIGGSITAGAAATQQEKRFGNLVAQWWRLNFPRAKIRFVNAGIGATGSDYGALRAERDLLSKQPDFVVVGSIRPGAAIASSTRLLAGTRPGSIACVSSCSRRKSRATSSGSWASAQPVSNRDDTRRR
jgi:hypothetical protein